VCPFCFSSVGFGELVLSPRRGLGFGFRALGVAPAEIVQEKAPQRLWGVLHQRLVEVSSRPFSFRERARAGEGQSSRVSVVLRAHRGGLLPGGSICRSL